MLPSTEAYISFLRDLHTRPDAVSTRRVPGAEPPARFGRATRSSAGGDLTLLPWGPTHSLRRTPHTSYAGWCHAAGSMAG